MGVTNKDYKRITILGIGNLLFSDEGIGIHAIQKLKERYEFPDNVILEDGGTLGLALLGVLSDADFLIVIDAIKNRGEPGSFYRIEGDEIPKRIRAKNSLHQVDFLETLAACKLIGKVPHTIILGVEPEDIDTFGIELTPKISGKLDALIGMVLNELDRVGIRYQMKKS
jgi:hydrogenase maturation protease